MNEFIMKPDLLQEVLAEINKIKPHLEVCLAPKMARKKHGSSALRTGEATALAVTRDKSSLDASAAELYKWLGPGQSRVRMLMTYQAQGGLSFVALAHHRCAQAFCSHGNTEHLDGRDPSVTLEEFQKAIHARHQAGSNGLEAPLGDGFGADFQPGDR